VSTNDFTGWLLDAAMPSIRYLTLRHLLDLTEDDPEVRSARTAIMQTGPVPVMLAKQTADGHWEGERSFYTPKYVSTHWSMVLMVEFAADPDDPRVQQGVEFMLADTESRVLDSHAPEQQDWVCFWGNLLRYVAYCGRADDPRVGNIVKTLVLASQARGWGCRHNDELACAWGAVRALWGLAALPADQRTPEIEAAIQSGVEFVYDPAYSLSAGDYPTPGAAHKHWSRLNFPLFYQADILFALRVAADLGVLDQPRAREAVNWLVERRQANGRWRGTSPYRSNTWRDLGDRAETDRWVSLHAALVLKRAGYSV
jgi:hypothetical protein